jgi:hypothetical protein
MFEDISNILTKDCSIFLKELKKIKSKHLLYRGYKKELFDFKKIKTRKDRRPKDMSEEIYNEFNIEFKHKFGWKPRSEGVFATSNISEAGSYGTIFLFFPVGKYKFIWSETIKDLFYEIENEEWYTFNEHHYDHIYSYEWNEIYGEGGHGSWYFRGENLKVNDYNDALDKIELKYDKHSEYELKWVPDKSEDDYFEEKIKDMEELKEKEIQYYVSLYKEKNLKDAIKSGNEITFKCDYYYLVDTKWQNDLLNFLHN